MSENKIDGGDIGLFFVLILIMTISSCFQCHSMRNIESIQREIRDNTCKQTNQRRSK